MSLEISFSCVSLRPGLAAKSLSLGFLFFWRTVSIKTIIKLFI